MLQHLWHFRRYGRPYRATLIGGLGLRIAELLADLAQPWPIAIVIDGVLGRHRLHGALAAVTAPLPRSPVALLTAAAVASLLIALVSGLTDYAGDRVMNGAGERITAAIRRELFGRLQRLPMSFHDRRAVGELTSRLTVDTDRIEDGLVDVFSTLLPGVLTLGGLATVLLMLDWRLGLVALASAPLAFWAAARYSRLTRQAARARRRAEGALAGTASETLAGIRTVHAHARYDVHDDRFADHNQATLAAGLRAVELRARFTPLLEICAATGTAALLWLGGYGSLHGWWTVGTLVVALTYLRTMLKPIRSLSKLSLTLSQAAAAAERVREILDRPAPELVASHPRGPVGTTASRTRSSSRGTAGRLELRSVSADYGRGLVLNGISLRVECGERLAIRGANGAGKSSLLALLTGLYTPLVGQVLIDDRPLSDLTPEQRGSRVAVLLQDTVLFSGTIRDNIAYGRPGATEEQILQAADEALVSEFTNQLPHGLDTAVDEGNVGLSGGQRQRVGIARALLADAPIVLLDEPTSGLDLHAEALVTQALQRLMHGRTVIMTTHRPRLLDLATREVWIKNGRLRPSPRPARVPGREEGVAVA
jgi:ABC-type multidrug transport system fused ATPase/permease subunit